MSDREWVTLHAGPPWELDLFCGMLDDACIPWRRPDGVVGGVGSLVDPTGAACKRLQVPAADAERAAAQIASHRVPASEANDVEECELTGEQEVELVARYVRGASGSLVGVILAPWLLLLYRRACREHETRSKQHALTLAAPWIAGAVILALVLAFRIVPGWFPDRTPDPGPPPPPPAPTRILPG